MVSRLSSACSLAFSASAPDSIAHTRFGRPCSVSTYSSLSWPTRSCWHSQSAWSAVATAVSKSQTKSTIPAKFFESIVASRSGSWFRWPFPWPPYSNARPETNDPPRPRPLGAFISAVLVKVFYPAGLAQNACLEADLNLRHGSFARVVIFTLLSVVALVAQVPSETNPAKQQVVLPSSSQTAPLTKEDVEVFLDGFMPMQLQREDIAGAVVMIVKDGRVLFAKGYGFSDVKSRKPVTVEATLFRPGSLSKTFTSTAVMQLVEPGNLAPTRAVNDYLDFKIPAPFGKPITLLDIMTHTPGFEEQIKDLFVANASDVHPLNRYLPTHIPRQIFPPATTPAYSNYATALAGYIVQRVSGMPFEDYIEKNILHPLEMSHTTFRQPLPDNLKPLMSEGDKKASEAAKPFEFVQE